VAPDQAAHGEVHEGERQDEGREDGVCDADEEDHQHPRHRVTVPVQWVFSSFEKI
jgi:hypothetical protein